ncbi:MAG TPA: peptidylprolyl isomerase [Sphingomicrobium sp.]|nr:peptidylprolyl isomerase [Sphingomicrobium sp.]
MLAALAAAKDPPPATPALTVVPPAAIAADPANRLTLELSNGGKVVILLRPDAAPNHVQRIRQLVQSGFYNGTIFHRVIPGFMAQGGDPKGTGQGGSPLPDLKAEFNSLPHLRGTFAMARADDPDSANSQFYIAFGPKASLDRNYTILGRVIAGMDAVDRIAVGEPPAQPTKIIRASLESAPPVAAAPAPTGG